MNITLTNCVERIELHVEQQCQRKIKMAQAQIDGKANERESIKKREMK